MRVHHGFMIAACVWMGTATRGAASVPRKILKNVEPNPMMTEFMKRSPNLEGPTITMSYWRTISSAQFCGGLASRNSCVCLVRVVKRFT